MQLLTFTIDDRRYGIDTRRVVEVLPLVIPRPLPRQPAEVLGLIRYRGRFLPSIDLGQVIAGRRCRDRLGTRTIVVRLEHEQPAAPAPLQLALVAEDVIGITSAAAPPARPLMVDGPFGPMVELAGETGSGQPAQLLAIDTILPAPQLATLLGLAGASASPPPATDSDAVTPSP